MPFDTSKKQFQVIYVPCDNDKDMEEMIAPIHGDKVIEAMIEFVKAHMDKVEIERKAKASQLQLQYERAQVGKQLQAEIQKNPNLKGVVLTDDMINRIYLSNAIDSIPVIPHCKATNYVGVMMYVDDQGMSKKLPRNLRATQILFSCGNYTEVLGDCFLARILDDNDDNFMRLDLSLTDLSDPRFLAIARGFAAGKIKQTMTHEEAMKILNLPPEPSLIPTIDPSGDEGANAPSAKIDPDAISHEVTEAYTKSNKALGDSIGLCARGFIVCYKTAKLRCARCRNVFYCCPDHQKSDWKRHKLECKPPTSAVTASSPAPAPAPKAE